jgi:hypothetical protein
MLDGTARVLDILDTAGNEEFSVPRRLPPTSSIVADSNDLTPRRAHAHTPHIGAQASVDTVQCGVLGGLQRYFLRLVPPLRGVCQRSVAPCLPSPHWPTERR